jgi:transposase-like protein
MAKRGRPTEYQDSHPERAYKLVAKMGHTLKELAVCFGVVESTISKWVEEHPEFSDSIKRGREDFDTGRVEKALAYRACGYSHPTEEIKVVDGEIIRVPVIKHYPPDPVSMIFWLKNRQPAKWRDKTDVAMDANVTIEILRQGDDDEDSPSK